MTSFDSGTQDGEAKGSLSLTLHSERVLGLHREILFLKKKMLAGQKKFLKLFYSPNKLDFSQAKQKPLPGNAPSYCVFVVDLGKLSLLSEHFLSARHSAAGMFQVICLSRIWNHEVQEG